MPDVLIVNGRLVDGTGNPWQDADVAITGDRVSAITPPGRLDPADAAEVVDATGQVVCPGFIDIQSHSIIPLMIDGRCLGKITQGVTTEIMGELWTPAPFGGQTDQLAPFRGAYRFAADLLAAWEERMRDWRRFGDWLAAMIDHGVSPNIGSFLGGGTVRSFAKGLAMGAATADETATMQRVVVEAMEDGAFGVAYALIYPPDAYASTDELVAVCQAMAPLGGIYITHMRSEANELLEGVEEALAIGQRAGVPVEIYHLKASGRANWSKLPAVIARLEQARAAGQDVTADMYPYTVAGTGLDSVLPPWLAADGRLFDNLRDPALRARARAEVVHPSGGWEPVGTLAGPDGIIPLSFFQPANHAYAGRSLAAIAAERGQDWVETVMDLLLSEQQRINTAYELMSEENLRLQLRQPWIKISTDAGGYDPARHAPHGPTHPRAYGTYPRVLGKYVRDEGIIPLEDAIRKMTSAVADRLGLRDRGQLRPGLYADVVAFNPAAIADRATFTDSHQLSVGVRDVWVNGQRVVQNGTHTGATPGRIVSGPGRR
jgi:N-acyl-D-aspartate/D-glutamate deacylase